MRFTRRTLIAGLAALGSAASARRAASPLRRRIIGKDGREIDVWVWPARGARKGRIHFSHGNFSSPIKYARLIEGWAADGTRYALTSKGVDHYFGGIIGRPELPGARQEEGFASLQVVSRLFLEAYGLRKATARAAW